MIFDLFVMVTNGKEDAVRQSGKERQCRAAPIFCGIEGELYPDARPLGYPFDRPIYKSNNIDPTHPSFDAVDGPITLEEWITEIPNSAFNKVVITHVDETRGGVQVFDVGGQAGGNFIGDGGVPALPTSVGNGLGAAHPGIIDSPGIQENFGPSAGIKHLAQGTDFFNEFFSPHSRPTRNHPTPEIDAPPKEFFDFIAGKK
jgi:hypothetical protein